MNIYEEIIALQDLCAEGVKHKLVVEFCHCKICQSYPQHIIVVSKKGKRVRAGFQIIREGLIEKVRISFPQVGKAEEYPLGLLKAFSRDGKNVP